MEAYIVKYRFILSSIIIVISQVLTAQEIQQQKEDQLKNSSPHIQPKDPYKDKPKLDKFVAEVEKLAKFIEGLEKPLCSGPTPLDVVWKVSCDSFYTQIILI